MRFRDSQARRIYHLLSDLNWHTTDQILAQVYGNEHLGIARIGARVYDINKKIRPKGWEVVSRKGIGTVWMYKLNKI